MRNCICFRIFTHVFMWMSLDPPTAQKIRTGYRRSLFAEIRLWEVSAIARKAKNEIKIGNTLRCICERRRELVNNPFRIAQMVNPRSRSCVFFFTFLCWITQAAPLITLFRRRARVILYISRSYFRDGETYISSAIGFLRTDARCLRGCWKYVP